LNRRLLLALPLVGALGAFPALAADHDAPAPTVPAPAAEGPDPSAVPVQASLMTGTASFGLPGFGNPTRASDDLDQGSIFRILCGGLPDADIALSRHLWQVAGTLADSSWTPPRVTVRVVVSDPAVR